MSQDAQDNEQYRSGFEAAYPFAKEVRDKEGGYQGVMGIRWETWAEAKREASTEPSAKPNASIVEDVIDLFAACGFEVRPDGGPLAIAGSIDAAGVLVEAVIEKFSPGDERFHWTRKGMELDPNGFYVHYRKSDDLNLAGGAQKDAARLDWLEQMANEPGGLLLHDGGDFTGRRGIGLRRVGRTLRQAIDAACPEIAAIAAHTKAQEKA